MNAMPSCQTILDVDTAWTLLEHDQMSKVGGNSPPNHEVLRDNSEPLRIDIWELGVSLWVPMRSQNIHPPKAQFSGFRRCSILYFPAAAKYATSDLHSPHFCQEEKA